MIKYVTLGQSITVQAGSQSQTLTADIDVQNLFWPALKAGNVEQSARAHALLDQALKCKEELWIIGDKANAAIMGGAAYGAYNGTYKHVMVWDPTITLDFDPTGVWIKKPVSKWATDKTEMASFKSSGASISLPPYVALLHELGHFSQFLDRHDWYMDLVSKQRGPDSTSLFTGCQGDIESDNLARNEWPICTDLGLAKRQTYWDRPGEVRLVADLNKFGVL